jgi:acetoin utilization deacetylase AcuC-like enzyme
MQSSIAKAWRRGRRRLSTAAGNRGRVQFVYSRRYQVELPGVAYDFQRGERILTFLDAVGLLDRGDVHAAEPIPFRYLRRVHTDDYLSAVTRPDALLRIVGLQLSEELAERVLEAQRTMVGGTLAAARLAVASRGIAVSLGGGMHHAFADRGERFCVYNDVATAIAELRAQGTTSRILVIDLDVHDGDGTRSIFAADPTVHTFSIHNHTSTGIQAYTTNLGRTSHEYGTARALRTSAKRTTTPYRKRYSPPGHAPAYPAWINVTVLKATTT